MVIDGANFVTNGTTVKFGGSNSTSVTVVAATQLQAVVPNGATNGLITVSTTNGVCVSSNIFRTGFTSGITDFNPTFGACRHDYVGIDGFDFIFDDQPGFRRRDTPRWWTWPRSAAAAASRRVVGSVSRRRQVVGIGGDDGGDDGGRRWMVVVT